MKNDASAKRICEQVKQWELKGRLDIEPFKDALGYFKRRYVSDNGFTHLFEGLNFRPRDRRPLVENVLSGENRNAADGVAALLVIVYRLRNNLLHGEKWDYGLQEQEENFKNANQVLMMALGI